ncbi:hypothetical protein AMAG_00913 [Allomyces macrogynus ATCC 38327]|uniref:Alpha/beta hydrolase fold-3 domain-containing protein n=1 Tax=Allomyces macrogynus (strain ATCC 38327) TaxID=578462 RepID=A0A0L0RXX1_ALLM3|nr:hypothetical protein AMAG_00913 [Allomyces macrogynus ATCC 38327]|eukprot:KNE54975.1 hypothetical protein AMAG_00913 [Allomyces macrogynus ATCC 38327]
MDQATTVADKHNGRDQRQATNRSAKQINEAMAVPSTFSTGKATLPERAPLVLLVFRVVSAIVRAVATVAWHGRRRASRTLTTELGIQVTRRVAVVPGLPVFIMRPWIMKAYAKIDAKPSAPWRSGFAQVDVRKWRAQVTLETKGGNADGLPVVDLADSALAAKYPRPTTSWTMHGEWLIPKPEFVPASGLDKDHVVVFVHGGAFCLGSALESRNQLLPHLAQRWGVRIFNVDYRTSPHAQFPDAIHDVVSAIRYLTTVDRIPSSRITLMGESAGANLCLATAMYLRDHAHSPLHSLLLLSPWFDLTCMFPSHDRHANWDITPDPRTARAEHDPIGMYLGALANVARRDPHVSPATALDADLAQLPPIYIATGADERLADEHLVLSARVRRAGGTVVHDLFVDQHHGWFVADPDHVDSLQLMHRAAAVMADPVRAAVAVDDDVMVEVVRRGVPVDDRAWVRQYVVAWWKHIEEVLPRGAGDDEVKRKVVEMMRSLAREELAKLMRA